MAFMTTLMDHFSIKLNYNSNLLHSLMQICCIDTLMCSSRCSVSFPMIQSKCASSGKVVNGSLLTCIDAFANQEGLTFDLLSSYGGFIFSKSWMKDMSSEKLPLNPIPIFSRIIWMLLWACSCWQHCWKPPYRWSREANKRCATEWWEWHHMLYGWDYVCGFKHIQ